MRTKGNSDIRREGRSVMVLMLRRVAPRRLAHVRILRSLSSYWCLRFNIWFLSVIFPKVIDLEQHTLAVLKVANVFLANVFFSN